MRILITGGAGYVGSRLVPALLEDGHDVIVYDTFWFGDHLPQDGMYGTALARTRADIRDIDKFKECLNEVDTVVHLACLSNDPSADGDAEFTKSINLDAFEPLVIASKEAGVRRFINCSTSSVYGVSDAPDVREDHSHVPLTLYNTYKSQCETLLWPHMTKDFECVTIRPSTVCGYSPRQRLDLAVNILTNQAYNVGKITVLGGDQKRPNLHIEDMVDCYRALIKAPAELIQGETFNVGAGNISIANLARIVQEAVKHYTGREIDIETRSSIDPRSYQVNSDKIGRVLGYRARRSVYLAVQDLCKAFDAGKIPEPMDRDEYVNVRQMRKLFPDLYKGAPPTAFKPEDGVLSEQDMIRGAKA